MLLRGRSFIAMSSKDNQISRNLLSTSCVHTVAPSVPPMALRFPGKKTSFVGLRIGWVSKHPVQLAFWWANPGPGSRESTGIGDGARGVEQQARGRLSSRRSSRTSACCRSAATFGCRPRSSSCRACEPHGAAAGSSSQRRWSRSSPRGRSSRSRRTRRRSPGQDTEWCPGRTPWKSLWRAPHPAGRTWQSSACHGEPEIKATFLSQVADCFFPTMELGAFEIWFGEQPSLAQCGEEMRRNKETPPKQAFPVS